jgi:hypothetical protein
MKSDANAARLLLKVGSRPPSGGRGRMLPVVGPAGGGDHRRVGAAGFGLMPALTPDAAQDP